MSPSARISGWPASDRSGSTVSRPARSVSAPASEASIPASGDAVTPAAQTTVRAEMRSVSPLGSRTVTPRASTSTTMRRSIGVTPLRSRERRARSESDRREAREDPLAGLDQHDAAAARVGRAEVAAQAVPREFGDLPGHLDAGGPGADDDERQPRPSQLIVRRHLGRLERAEDRRAGDQSALERLDLVRELRPGVVAEVRVVRATGDDQRVVGDAGQRGHAGHRRELEPAPLEVDRARLRHQDADVARAPEDRAQRVCDFARRERPGRDLVGQGLEEVEVAAVDERDLDVRTPQVLHRLQASEAAADDDDAVCACRLHPVPPRLDDRWGAPCACGAWPSRAATDHLRCRA